MNWQDDWHAKLTALLEGSRKRVEELKFKMFEYDEHYTVQEMHDRVKVGEERVQQMLEQNAKVLTL